jgi:hypothetical protein
VQKTIDSQSEENAEKEVKNESEERDSCSSRLQKSSNPASWSALKQRYRNLWRVRISRDMKNVVAKFAILVGVMAIFGSFTGIIISSFLGVVLVTYESYKGNVDKFVSAHIGAVAGIPSVMLAFSLVLSASTLGQSLFGLSIGLMYMIMYPILYYIYSDIGTELGKEKRANRN